MNDPRIILQVDGIPEEDGYLDFEAFMAKLEDLMRVLRASEHSFGSGRRSVRYRLLQIQRASPYTITLEARERISRKPPRVKPPDRRKEVIQRAVGTMSRIAKEGRVPINEDPELLEAVRDFTRGFGRKIGPGSLTVPTYDLDVPLTAEVGATVERGLATVMRAHGSLSGKMLAIDLSGDSPICALFPEIGPRRVVCRFKSGDRQLAKSAIDLRVEVVGLLHFRKGANHPHQIDVEAVNHLPGESDLPTLMDLRGTTPGATGDLSSEEFVRRIRDGH